MCSLVYTDEALACVTMPSFGSVYNKYVLDDLQNCGKSFGSSDGGIVITGHSFEGVIAHQIALQILLIELEVRLVLYHYEVQYPPAPDEDRLGGYDWLGGETEATLLGCRFCGLFDEAVKAVQKFLADPDKRDAQAFKIEVEGVAASRGITRNSLTTS